MAVRKDLDLTCRDKENSNKTPLCIHRSPPGTHEWFIGGDQLPASSHRRLHAGNCPLWLAPDQVRIITLNDDDEKTVSIPQCGTGAVSLIAVGH